MRRRRKKKHRDLREAEDQQFIAKSMTTAAVKVKRKGIRTRRPSGADYPNNLIHG